MKLPRYRCAKLYLTAYASNPTVFDAESHISLMSFDKAAKVVRDTLSDEYERVIYEVREVRRYRKGVAVR